MKNSYSLYIDGSWCEASNNKRFDVTNPADESVVATVPDGTAADMKRAIDAAARVQQSWADTPAATRSKILARAAAMMREQTDELAAIMTMEEGKPLGESRGEIAYAASFLEWFAGEAVRVYGDVIPANSTNKRILVVKRPVGVTAAITPWNFPAAMITRKLGPALAAGCTMIVKPAQSTPLSAFEVARIFEDAGLPAGVLSVVVGTHTPELVNVLMNDFRVRKVSFTGSTEIGKLLMKQASDTMKRVSLELGGHAPLIVFDDADVDLAVSQTIVCKMRGMGETCVSTNRIYVQNGVVEEYTAKLTERLRQMRVGNGLEAGVEVGPLINSAAIDKVQRHVDDALSKGAKLRLGGHKLSAAKGNFYEPTVLTDITEDMLVSQEETFGPVANIAVFDTEDEVVAKANNTRYGLAAYFFTRDAARLFRLADRLEYGIIGANDGLPSTAQAPFGGVKESGFGREGSKYGIQEYLDVKYVSIGGVDK